MMAKTLRKELREAFQGAGETPERAAILADIAMQIAGIRRQDVDKSDLPLDWQLGVSDDPVQVGKAAHLQRVKTTWDNIVRYQRWGSPAWIDFETWLLNLDNNPLPLETVLAELVKDSYRANSIRGGLWSPDGDRSGRWSLKATIMALDCFATGNNRRDPRVPRTLDVENEDGRKTLD